ncbi:hypothetical protein L21SP5_03358 [Salinivirga cyanobacteriivorans]|uniref:Lipocalin-like domain-containing protein n=1 Tax=Salinivirga cyanobacteriivorans TaxID=1307839 RepID=A0A0S2I450_9BACT|nr:hypothetical protein [Salinivirga cyanobacteriivorans]ALO16971.1 hypothetical protein L21SP5_03358 [Salinivirga cyanobacteriivorans]
MKHLFIIVFFITFLGLNIGAQTLTDSDIVGTWTVKKVNLLIELSEEQKQKMKVLEDAFLNSKFEFEADKNFSFLFEFKDMEIQNGHWKYDELSNSFIIQEWKNKETDKGKLMAIKGKREGEKILFFLDESNLVLEMEKEQ